MSRSFVAWIAVAGFAGSLVIGPPAGAALDDSLGFEHTPPRLAFIDGEVSFYRPGTQYWEPASVNTPLAAGDELYAAEEAKLEIQLGARAYLRAGQETQLALETLEPDLLQISVPEGHVSLDLRSVDASRTLEIGTPNASFTIERNGYYRVEVDDDTTRFVARRGGRARVTPASGASTELAADEQVVIRGDDAWQLETFAAPELDAWDRWNQARTDARLEAESARYVAEDVYGVDDLDHHGSWRVEPSYGAVWVPDGTEADWAPYSAGRWIHDPYYGWSWVDAAPWGWAPYHYGRWVRVSGVWGWAPGPLVVRPRYAPALVAFFGGGGVSLGISIGGAPRLGWLPLGWGEPIVPWWGPAGVRGVPRWAGWGGPRVVNRVVVKRRTVIHAREIHRYEHTHVHKAFVAVAREDFGRRRIAASRVRSTRIERYAPVRGDLEVRPRRERRLASSRVVRPPHRERRARFFATERTPRVEAVSTRRTHRPHRTRHEPSVAPRPRPRVELASRREASRRDADSKRREAGVRKKRRERERAASKEQPRRRAERARDARGRKERSARSPSSRERTKRAAREIRERKPERERRHLARSKAPARRDPRARRRTEEARRSELSPSARSARIESGERARKRSDVPDRKEKSERRARRRRGDRQQAEAETARETRRSTRALRKDRRPREHGRRS
jgi:hypothetical protein